MSKVNRSTYQKLKEENKRLLRDIYLMTMKTLTTEAFMTKVRWRDKFKKEEEFDELMRQFAKKYLKEHPEYDIKRKMEENERANKKRK